MQSSPILLTGVRGQVGGELLPLLQRFGHVVAPHREELDLANSDALRTYVRELAPRLIVNPAAYTAVDKAESEPELAHAINAAAPAVLGEEAARLGIPVLHFSTDYVFAGDGTEPWTEDSPTGPLGVYGATKLAGEQALAASGAVHMIFRTSWVYGARGKNFLLTILRLAAEREELRIVADQHGAPTWSQDLARLVEHVVEQGEHASATSGATLAEALTPHSGTYHAVNTGETTWFGFAEEVVRLARLTRPEQTFARVVPIATADFPHASTPASKLTATRRKASRGPGLPHAGMAGLCRPGHGLSPSPVKRTRFPRRHPERSEGSPHSFGQPRRPNRSNHAPALSRSASAYRCDTIW